MTKLSRIALMIAAVLLLISGSLYIANRPIEKSPDVLIGEALDDAAAAARKGDTGAFMDVVSDDFRSGSWNKARLRLLLNRTLNEGRGVNYDVHVNAPRIQPSPRGRPNERLVITRFAAFYTGPNEDIYKTNDAVMLIMRAETRRRALVLSEPRWRIVSILNLPALPGAGGGGEDIGM